MAGEKYPVGDVQFDGNGTGPFRGGRFSDRKLAGRMARNRPWLLLEFGAAGIIAGYRSIFRLLKKVQTEQQEEESRKWVRKIKPPKIRIITPILPARWRMLWNTRRVSLGSGSDPLHHSFDREWNLDPARRHLELDYLLGVFLGCSVVGLNFHWRYSSVTWFTTKSSTSEFDFLPDKICNFRPSFIRGTQLLGIPPLIIGLSNILLAVVAYSVINSMKRAPVQEPEENKEWSVWSAFYRPSVPSRFSRRRRFHGPIPSGGSNNLWWIWASIHFWIWTCWSFPYCWFCLATLQESPSGDSHAGTQRESRSRAFCGSRGRRYLNFLDGIIRHGTGARPILPLLGTYGMFILCLNLSGLVPGFNPPTDQFNVTIAFALIIFLGTHFLGIRQLMGELHQTISRPNAPACPVDVSNRVDQSSGETIVPLHPTVREHDRRP